MNRRIYPTVLPDAARGACNDAKECDDDCDVVHRTNHMGLLPFAMTVTESRFFCYSQNNPTSSWTISTILTGSTEGSSACPNRRPSHETLRPERGASSSV